MFQLTVEKDSGMFMESEQLMCSYGEGGVALDEEDDAEDDNGEEEEDGADGGGEDFLLSDRSTGSICACAGAAPL